MLSLTWTSREISFCLNSPRAVCRLISLLTKEYGPARDSNGLRGLLGPYPFKSPSPVLLHTRSKWLELWT
ncbi:hypothetical protein HanIR_Chr05g0213111 [Helianthus annuus]|nr:hypothetical protein HanIR_Chr05g0213111 [Helianthus annuus]